MNLGDHGVGMDAEATIRLMKPEDEAALSAFAAQLPTRDLLFLPRDIRHPKVVRAWMDEMATGDLTTLLAFQGQAVVGCGTVARDALSWSRHVAEIRCVLSPDARGRGIGSELILETFRWAVQGGAVKIVAQMTTDQKNAIAAFEGLGFTPEAILRDHVVDDTGAAYDLVVFAHRVAEVAHRLNAYGLGEL